MKDSKMITVICSVALGILILSGAVAVAILLRPFYYAHVDYLALPDKTGISSAQIKEAYDQIMDYCVGGSGKFSTGVFCHSESGAQHFNDVRVLFRLDLILAKISALSLAGIYLVCKKCKLRAYRFCGFGPFFWSAASVLTLFITIGGLASLNFDLAFVIFHKLFFPGKSNWLFSSVTDPIIDVLPQVFFRNCAILILAIVLIICLCFILLDVKKRKRA